MKEFLTALLEKWRYKGKYEALLKDQQKKSRANWYAYHLAGIALGMPQEKIGVDVNHLETDTRDKVRKLQEQFPEIKIISVFRTFAEQSRLHRQGREDAGNIVTNAKAGQSYHNYGAAVDFFFHGTQWSAPYSEWEKVGIAAEKLGFEWGGRWKSKDLGHIEYHPNFEWQDLLTYFQNNG